MHLYSLFTLVATFGLLVGCQVDPAETEPPGPHIVFVTGDEEYRSEESMPMLARILERELGAKVNVCYSLDSAGYVDPNRTDHIAGLAALDSADLLVLFTRFRNLPPAEARHILDFAESGRPLVGFRTATHAFLYEQDSSRMHLNNEWPTRVFGQQWITHHGHFADGDLPLTAVRLIGEQAHPIVRGVEPFDAYSWLYHVDGGEWQLYGDSQPLMEGRALRSHHEANGNLDKFPLTNPVAWTKTYTGTSGRPARVFFTTLGHPYDFKLSAMRKLALNGIYWALGREAAIPPEGVNATVVGTYEPNNSGFGEKYKKNLQPVLLH